MTLSILQPEEELKIRKIVAAGTPNLVDPKMDFQSIVVMPEELSAAYKVKPIGVLHLLLRITDGANPEESVTAATYALALLDPNGGGVVCIEHFKKTSYDVVDKFWEGKTPRYYWIGKIKQAIRTGK